MTGGLAKQSIYLLAGASIIGLLAANAPEARAQDLQQIQAQIQEMQATNREMQATIKVLQKQVQDAKAQAAAANVTAANAGGEDLDLKVKWRGAPEFSSGDGKFKFKVRGRVETDYNNIDQDTPITFAPDVSATALRRARIGVEGVMFYDFKYLFEVDFAENAVAIRDAYLQYTGLPADITVGNFKTYNSLEHLMSANNLTFMERAAFIEAFGIDRQIGAGVSYNKDHFTLAAGGFGATVAPQPLFNPGFGQPAFIGDEGRTVAARATVAPINREVNGVNQVLHFGASGRWRETGNDEPFFQYQARAADLFLANRFVNTNRIGESDTLWGLEAAGVWGPLSVQGEYAELEVGLPGGTTIRQTSTATANGLPLAGGDPSPGGTNPPFIVPPVPTRANPFVGISDPTYTGWYVDASVFLTGETRPYKDGVFQRVKVKNPVRWGSEGGWGAWQIAARYDFLSLSDSAFNDAGGCPLTTVGINTLTGAEPARIGQCGEQETWLIALNWYLNDYTRIMFNYTQSELSGYPVSALSATNTTYPSGQTSVAGFDGATIRGFGTRVHVDW